MPQELELQIHGLSTLLHIDRQVRNAADLIEFNFISVNETKSLISYRQGILWRSSGPNKGSIEAISGLAEIDRNAPFIIWLKKILKLQGKEIKSIGPADLPAHLADEWQHWLPENGIWLPLLTKKDEMLGALFLAREEPWQEHEVTILSQLCEIYSYTWANLLGKRWNTSSFPWLRKTIFFFAVLTIIGGLFFIPVRLSALAPAEVIPLDPVFVRAPLEGIIDVFHVAPNQEVRKGQKLFSLEDTTLKNRLEIAKKSLAVAEAEYMKASKEAFYSKEVKATINTLKELQAEKKAEVSYLEELLKKITVTSNIDGLAIFSDITDWVGKPVAIGEKILTLAQIDKAELEINLPVDDAISLTTGAEVLYFLNVNPESKINANLTYASFQANQTPDGTLVYRLKAKFSDPAVPRIGLKGTAKIYGKKTNLFYLIFRRPLAYVRQHLGI